MLYEVNSPPLPRGRAVSRTLFRVDEKGIVLVEVIDFEDNDIRLQPRTPIALLQNAAPEQTVDMLNVGAEEVIVVARDTTRGMSPAEILTARMDVSTEEHAPAMSLMTRHASVFSRDGTDLGRCDAVEHRFITTDEIPIRVPHRRIPPQQWDKITRALHWRKVSFANHPARTPLLSC